jgi:hypothetical protein
MISKISLALAVTASAAFADGAMPSDEKFDQTALTELLVGKTITFYDKGQSDFQPDGKYSYTYFEGDSAYGEFLIGNDSSVCIAFENGFSRCDTYVMNNDRLVMIATDGERYPIKNSVEN